MVWGGTASSRARQGRGVGEGEKEGKRVLLLKQQGDNPTRQISPLWDHTLPLDLSRTLGIDSQIPWIQFRHAKGWVPPAPSPAEEAAYARSGAAPPLPGFKPCLLQEKNPPLSSPSNMLGWKLWGCFTCNSRATCERMGRGPHRWGPNPLSPRFTCGACEPAPRGS